MLLLGIPALYLLFVLLETIFAAYLYTYTLGEAGLIIRPLALVIGYIGLMVILLKPDKTKNSRKKGIAGTIGGCVFATLLFGFVIVTSVRDTMRDIEREPITQTLTGRIHYRHRGASFCFRPDDYDVEEFTISRLETWEDGSGNVVFSKPVYYPSFIGTFFWKEDIPCRITVTYYPNSNTRVAIHDVERL